jgi:hypothetical protein
MEGRMPHLSLPSLASGRLRSSMSLQQENVVVIPAVFGTRIFSKGECGGGQI